MTLSSVCVPDMSQKLLQRSQQSGKRCHARKIQQFRKSLCEWPVVYEGTSTNVTKHLSFRTGAVELNSGGGLM